MIGVATATTPGAIISRRAAGRDVDDAGVVRALGVVHDPGHLAELATDLDDDRLGGRADGADGQRAEEVDEHRAHEGGDEHVDVGQVDRGEERLAAVRVDEVDLVDVGAEQQEGGQRRRGDRVALGQRLGRVADGVEPIGDLAGARLGPAELGDAAGVVGDRAERVHRQDVGGGHEHAHGRDGGPEDAPDVLAVGVDDAGLRAEPVAGEERDADRDRGREGRLEADRHARDDVGGRAGLGRLRDLPDRPERAGRVVLGDVHEGDARGEADDAGRRRTQTGKPDGALPFVWSITLVTRGAPAADRIVVTQ